MGTHREWDDGCCRQAEKLKVELARALKELADQKAAGVWTLGDLRGMNTGSDDWENRSTVSRGTKRDRERSDGWEKVTVQTNLTRASSIAESRAMEDELCAEDKKVLLALKEFFLEHIWCVPGEESFYSRGTRPATVLELEAEALERCLRIDDIVDADCVAWFHNRKANPAPQAHEEVPQAPKNWPRRKRTRPDDVIKDRKIDVMQSFVQLVKNDLGELGHGPVMAAKTRGVELPESCEGGQLSAFLLVYLRSLSKEVCKPVLNPIGAAKNGTVIEKKTRNGYLTKLCKPIEYPVVKALLVSLWPHVQGFEWAGTVGYAGELEFLARQG